MEGPCDLGVIGLGVMGRNLLLHLAESGFAAAGHDRDLAKVDLLLAGAGPFPVRGAASPEALAGALRRPRTVILLVPAGRAVDAVLRALRPVLEPGDIVVDGGNSHFRDTDLRGEAMGALGILFVGLGISGGEEGARRGASLMAGGPPEARERIVPILEAAAARADGEPCAAWLGPGSAGHHAKMVHNGIEYALMELIAECYDLLKRGAGAADGEIADRFEGWSRDGLRAYLLDISADILRRVDGKTGKPLLEVILDEAGGKGTGLWTVQDALDLHVPVPAIAAAVQARDLSSEKRERVAAARLYRRPVLRSRRPREALAAALGRAFRAAAAIAFAQGMAVIRKASEARSLGVPLAEVARIWRAGCIIRTALLDPIRAAFTARPDLPDLLHDSGMAAMVRADEDGLREAVMAAARLRIPAPALAACLAHLDGARSEWLPASLIQAQRDYFGAHRYERTDERGTFHTEWTGEDETED